jgi:DNA-binding transcriptional ArsR family regulator
MSTELLASVAAAVADQARAAILLALWDGRSRTAKELAYLARVSASTASGHLAKLVDLGLLAVTPLGRNRYFRLASPLVGQMIEAMANVAADIRPRNPRQHGDPALRLARTCYDHLAGRLGVRLADALQAQGHIRLQDDGGEITGRGRDFFAGLGLRLDQGRPDKRIPGKRTSSKRIFCKPCLDWTERRPHLAGALGAALCRHCLDHGWVERLRDSRALRVTPEGERQFAELFAVVLDDAVGHAA